MVRHFLSVADWSPDELLAILERAADLKRRLAAGERPQTLTGRAIALYFEKPSLRTHVTFHAGIIQLGGNAIELRPEQVGIGTRESAVDVARNLSRWVDCIMMRTFSHRLVEEVAQAATIPVINGLTDLLHPCQAMADLQTLQEHMELSKLALAYVGDGNNVAHSLLLASAVLGLDMRVSTPRSHRPEDAVWRRAEGLARGSGARLRWSEDPVEAVRGASCVYTDTWISMGQEREREVRRRIFAPYQVNEALMAHAPDAFVMHCLPAHRGWEITDGVLDGPRSLVYDQAENRLHAQKAILERVIIDREARPAPASRGGRRPA
jgi:ornithine carbamoyltransferase